MLDDHDILIAECAEASASRQLIAKPLYSKGILGYRPNEKIARVLIAWADFGLEPLTPARG